jgi:hypothetical protein
MLFRISASKNLFSLKYSISGSSLNNIHFRSKGTQRETACNCFKWGEEGVEEGRW